jgi:uncharacterized membrane protein
MPAGQTASTRRNEMKEIEKFLSLYSDGLKSIAKATKNLAEKVQEIGKAMAENKPKKPAKPKDRPKAKRAKKSSKTKEKRPTAAETVLTIIKNSGNGVGYSEIMKKTGYDRKKVANIIFKLGKQGKIKSIKRGVYTKA